MTELYLVKRKDIDEQVFEKALITLPPHITDKVLAKVFIHDRQITLISEILQRHCLSQKLAVKRDKLEFTTNKWGKPYLKNFPKLFFNISHSGDYVVLIISDSEVGVDIEKEKSFDFDIVENFFSNREIEFFKSIKESERISTFFSIWTLKESYIKALGVGLNKNLNSFSIDITGDHTAVTDYEYPGNNTLWSIYNIPFEKSYHLAVCHTQRDTKLDSVTKIPMEELFSCCYY